ncbi:hypothetical protein CCAX7_53770 [Capsulimonas corticalis]|uniref:Uncharacterized protein n=1 Tax=Capsulimonas corticalis TaxID=2219043 RepID=A0A402CNP1_9BACT|nr:hypothetical protein [Capsulimonas corticalis]BDI33326.1 hypothetical protein CCAX7_53770 [Capsulimonas corticalis]
MKWTWNWLSGQVTKLFSSHKTAIGAVLTSAAVAALQSAQSGKVNWSAVGVAAVTTVGALAKSPLTPKQDLPTDNGAGDAASEGGAN